MKHLIIAIIFTSFFLSVGCGSKTTGLSTDQGDAMAQNNLALEYMNQKSHEEAYKELREYLGDRCINSVRADINKREDMTKALCKVQECKAQGGGEACWAESAYTTFDMALYAGVKMMVLPEVLSRLRNCSKIRTFGDNNDLENLRNYLEYYNYRSIQNIKNYCGQFPSWEGFSEE